MKKIALLIPCLLLSASIFAQTPATSAKHITSDGTLFRTTDNTPAAQLCVAALESREALREKAKDLRVNRRELKQVTCNDMSLVEFAKTHRDDIREWAIATVQ